MMKKIVLIGLSSMIVLPSIAAAQTMSPARHAGYPVRYQAQYNPAYQQQYPQIVPVAGQPMGGNGQIISPAPQQVQAQGQARAPQPAVMAKPYKKPKAFYVSTHIGASWMDVAEITNSGNNNLPETNDKIDEQTFAWSVAAGYDLRRHKIPLRAEISFTYRPELDYTQNTTVMGGATQYSHTATFQSYSVMNNIYYDYQLNDKIKPFVGGGIGFAFNKTKGAIRTNPNVLSGDYDQNEAKFSWNLMAGVAYQFSPRLSIEGMYKYSDMGEINWGDDSVIGLTSDSATDHQLLVGAKYHF